MPILINMSSLDHSSATEGHLEPAITLLDGRVLPCYPRREADGQPADSPKKDTSDRAEKFFTDHACFFFDHSERILSDSRMFLAPVPIQSGLAYVGGTGFRNPTLGVYIEWWMNHAPAIVGKSGKECWLVYHIAGSPLSGRNSCGMVNQKGELKGKYIPGQFKDLWVPFIQTNTRYDEAKERYEAYTLERVVELLKTDGKEVSQPERAIRFLQQKKVVFLHRIWGLVTPTPEEREKMRYKLLKHNKKDSIMEKTDNINYLLVSKAFEREGWTKHHLFMVGDKWKKGNDKVTCYYGHFKLNGTVVILIKIL